MTPTMCEIRDGSIVVAQWYSGAGGQPMKVEVVGWPMILLSGHMLYEVKAERLDYCVDGEVIDWWNATRSKTICRALSPSR